MSDTYFSFLFGGGAAPLITPEIILCQSLMPHVKFVMLNRRDGLFVFQETCWSFYKICKIKLSHTVCKGWDLSGFTRS